MWHPGSSFRNRSCRVGLSQGLLPLHRQAAVAATSSRTGSPLPEPGSRPTTVCAHTGCPLAPAWPCKVGLKPRSRGVGLRRDPAPSGAPSRKQPEERCSGLSRPACEVGLGMGLHREPRGESGPETGSLCPPCTGQHPWRGRVAGVLGCHEPSWWVDSGACACGAQHLPPAAGKPVWEFARRSW